MSITRYFRNALAAQLNPKIDLVHTKTIKATLQEIESGMLPPCETEQLFEDCQETEAEVLISLKTITAEVSGSAKVFGSIDDPTGVFFLPAILSKEGELSPSLKKHPWFVREFLDPTIEEELSVGKEEDVDRFLSDNEIEHVQADSWEKYWTFTRKMYEEVTGSDLYSDSIGRLENVHIDERCYVFIDTSVNASFHIRELYDAIIKCEDSELLPLYNKFISTIPPQGRKLLENDAEAMKKHTAQMGGNYPLSHSQRESLNHLKKLQNGEILAVSGPPGTGKTTLLQSVVADLFTKHALKQWEPPIIVASSTNNQAVTNIIDSFGHVPAQRLGNLEKRWVTAADSFAVYFPSSGKVKSAREKNYQINEDMLCEINSQERINESKALMLSECESYFNTRMTDTEECREALHNELRAVDDLRQRILNDFSNLIEETKGQTAAKYINDLHTKQEEINQRIEKLDRSIRDKRNFCKKCSERIGEWHAVYQGLSWYIRLLSFLPFYKTKILRLTQNFKNDNELLEFKDASTPNEIIELYHRKISSIENEIYDLRCNIAELRQSIDNIEEEENRITKMLILCARDIVNLEDKRSVYLIQNNTAIAATDFLIDLTLEELNNRLDVSARHVEFWLAVHYYECVWLSCKPLSERQLETNIDTVVCDKLSRLAMLSPCMVMTFFMLPKQFRVYNNDKGKYYLYDFIDLLIVDEAGQTSPEVAAAAFSLAKRAIVVGDEHQIPPVWGIKRPLDITLAMQSGVISKPKDFSELEECGLNTSQSSVMRVALRSCPYNKYDHGLFLSEHRRCYDEIIGYCNDLVYNKKLEALRGKGLEDKKRHLDAEKYPVIGYYNIHTPHSQKAGTSRINPDEANEIALWLQKHYNELCDAYECEKKDILAIITPFKAQKKIIEKALREALGASAADIEIGTVHAFQGAERRIIIFSTTYGSEDDCYFIDHNNSLMNVAVSRAKDAFWVFGSIDCLKNHGEMSASGLLYKYISGQHITPSET